MSYAVLGWYFTASVITFCVYAIDKSAARYHRQRISEKTLHIFGLMGGWPGAWVAQRTLRHKTKKRTFQIVFWGTMVLHCVLLIGVLMNDEILNLAIP